MNMEILTEETDRLLAEEICDTLKEKVSVRPMLRPEETCPGGAMLFIENSDSVEIQELIDTNPDLVTSLIARYTGFILKTGFFQVKSGDTFNEIPRAFLGAHVDQLSHSFGETFIPPENETEKNGLGWVTFLQNYHPDRPKQVPTFFTYLDPYLAKLEEILNEQGVGTSITPINATQIHQYLWAQDESPQAKKAAVTLLSMMALALSAVKDIYTHHWTKYPWSIVATGTLLAERELAHSDNGRVCHGSLPFMTDCTVQDIQNWPFGGPLLATELKRGRFKQARS